MTRWFLVSMLTLVCLPGWALRTGDIQTQSRLNEPLEAVLSISDVSAAEAANLQVRVASADIYAQLGLERSVAASDLRFAIEGQAPDNLRIRVRGQRPWLEPYVILVLDIGTSKGRLLREYTLLLDPAQAAPAPLVVAQPSPAPTALPVQEQARSALPAQAQMPAPARTEVATPTVRGVDTTAERQMAVPPPSVPSLATGEAVLGNTPIVDSADQRRIPTSARGNEPIVRGTQPGEVLRVRPGANLFAIAADIAGASSVGVSQAAWALYQNNPRAFAGSPDKLLRGARLTVPSVATMQRVSEGQAKSLLGGEQLDVAAGVPITPPPREVLRSEPVATRAPTPTRVTQVTPAPTAAVVAEAGPAKDETASADADSAQAVSESEFETPAESMTADTDDLLEESFLDESADATAASTSPSQADSAAVEKMPLWVWLGAAALVLVLLLLLLRKRRSGRDEEALASSAAPADDVGQARPMEDAFVAPVGTAQAEDEGEALESVSLDAAPLTDSDDETMDGLDDGVADPIAEADFHIAYGLYDEAERVLVQAREAQPERDDLIEKLAETYFASGNTQAFEALASEVHLNRPESAAWPRISEWGSQLLPAAALFASADSAPAEELGSLDLPEAESSSSDFATSAAEPESQAMDSDSEQADTDTVDLSLEEASAPLDEGEDEELSLDSSESDTERTLVEETPGEDGNVVEFELPEAPDTPNAPEPDQTDTGNIIDFDLDSDVPAEPSAEVESEAQPATLDEEFGADALSEPLDDAESSEEFSLSDLEADAAPDLELTDDVQSLSQAAEGLSGEELSDDDLSDGALEDVDFSLDDLQTDDTEEQGFDLDLEQQDNAAVSNVADTDSADMELSLDEFELDDSAIADDDSLSMEAEPELDDSGDESTSVVSHDEVVSTGDDMAGKLDLARAYIDMSELDMARSLLDEVALRGSAEQQSEAKSMLEQLG